MDCKKIYVSLLLFGTLLNTLVLLWSYSEDCYNIENVVFDLEDDLGVVEDVECESDADCGYGTCRKFSCVCDSGWSSQDDNCDYKMKDLLTTFLISFFVGALGVDWFFLSRGSCDYICLGIVKLLTVGGLGIWWLVDWIRVLAHDFPDGNGVELFE